MEFNRDLISCAIIKTDIVKPSTNYTNEENTFSYGRTFCVQYDEIEKTIKFIKLTGEELGVPVSRVYISGFALVSPSEILTKDKIVNYFRNELNSIRNKESVNKTLIK